MSEENTSQVDEKYCLDDTLLPSAETNHVNLRQYQTGALVKRQTKIDEPVRSKKKKSITIGKNQSSEKRRIFRCSGRKCLKLIPSLCSSSDMVEETQVTRSDPRPTKQTSSSSSTTCLSEKKEIGSKVTYPPMKLKVVEPIRSDLGPIRQTSSSSSKTGLSVKKEIGSKVTSPPVKLKVIEPLRSDPRPIRETSSSSKTGLSEKKEIGSKVTPPPMKLKVVEPIGSDPRLIRQTSSSSNTGLSEKKEIGSANLVTNSNTESKIRQKRIGSKITSPPMIVEPKSEDSNQTFLKFKKITVQEPKLNNKKINLKDKREGVGKINDEGEREKVVLRHRKVEEKEKSQKLFNNLIEETVNNKFEEGRKSKVKAIVGAFETVISLHDEKTQASQNTKEKMIQIKPTTMGM